MKLEGVLWPDLHPVAAAIIGFWGASLAGVARELRAGRRPDVLAIAAAWLQSGMWGCIVALVAYSRLRSDPTLLLGLSMLAGIGTADLVSLAVAAVGKRFGVTVRFERRE